MEIRRDQAHLELAGNSPFGGIHQQRRQEHAGGERQAGGRRRRLDLDVRQSPFVEPPQPGVHAIGQGARRHVRRQRIAGLEEQLAVAQEDLGAAVDFDGRARGCTQAPQRLEERHAREGVHLPPGGRHREQPAGAAGLGKGSVERRLVEAFDHRAGLGRAGDLRFGRRQQLYGIALARIQVQQCAQQTARLEVVANRPEAAGARQQVVDPFAPLPLDVAMEADPADLPQQTIDDSRAERNRAGAVTRAQHRQLGGVDIAQTERVGDLGLQTGQRLRIDMLDVRRLQPLRGVEIRQRGGGLGGHGQPRLRVARSGPRLDLGGGDLGGDLGEAGQAVRGILLETPVDQIHHPVGRPGPQLPQRARLLAR